MEPGSTSAQARVVAPAAVTRLVERLRADEYRVIGPVVHDGAIVYDEMTTGAELPTGMTDEQAPGSYRLVPRGDGALFGYAVGPQSWKRFLFPPRHKLWETTRGADGVEVVPAPVEPARFAFIGVRACELSAIAIQDRVFLRDELTDTVYATNRRDLLVIAVNCGTPSGTCFCASMGTGPRVPAGADLTMTELLDGGRHELLVEAGTEVGSRILDGLDGRPAGEDDLAAAEAVIAAAERSMGRTMAADGLRDVLAANLEHPRWDEVARRCLTCANCTLVCPTCFCSDVEDVSDLDGDHTERWRHWDSCFRIGFSHVGEGSVRTSPRSRYRQWLTHKLGTWVDQFGTSGCVGCGRCITWCPVGIDITEEVAAIRADDGAVREEVAG